MKQLLVLCLSMGCLAQTIHAVEMIDVLTPAEIVGEGYGNRIEYESEVTGARYVFAAAANTSAIQFYKSDASGIAVMESPGVLKSIAFDIASANSPLSLYGSNTPYESYKKVLSAEDELIANGILDTEKLPVVSSYKYFYIRPGGGIAKINSITIVWEIEKEVLRSDAPVIVSSNGLSFYPSTGISFIAGVDAEIYYSMDTALTEDNYQMVGIRYDGESVLLEKSAVVYAIAVEKDKVPSEVSVVSVERVSVVEFDNIAALLVADPVPAVTEMVMLRNPLTVTGNYSMAGDSSGYCLYVKDTTGELVIYSGRHPFPDGYVPGAVIVGCLMNYLVCDGMPEGVIADDMVSFGELLGADVEPVPTVVSTVDDASVNHYVKIENVKVVNDGLQIGSVLPIRNKFADYVMPEWNHECYYNIVGMVGCDHNQLMLYYLDSEIAHRAPAPIVYLEEDDRDLTTFDTTATFGMEVSGVDKASIYYTIDGTDPLESASVRLYAEPVRITATTVVKAYVEVEGMAPSAVVECIFTKVGTDVVYVHDFLNMEDKSASVKFVGDAIVTGHSVDYLFVEDAMGNNLAIMATEGWGDKRYSVGARISGFSVAHPAEPVANLNLAHADAGTFGDSMSGEIPVATTVDSNELLDESIVFGRVVTLADVTLEANELSRDAMGWSIYGVVPVDFSQFGDVAGWPSLEDCDGTYSVTGVVMPDDIGAPVVWPVSITSDGECVPMPKISGQMQFYKSTMVSISAVSGADIYYTIDGSEPVALAGGAVKRYVGAFEITASTIVKAIAVVSGQEPSGVAVARFVEVFTTGAECIEVGGDGDIYGVLGGVEAPEGVEIYDLIGRRVPIEGICPGVYIACFAGRTVKVVVR